MVDAGSSFEHQQFWPCRMAKAYPEHVSVQLPNELYRLKCASPSAVFISEQSVMSAAAESDAQRRIIHDKPRFCNEN